MSFAPNLGNISGLGQFLTMGSNPAFLNQLLGAGMHPGMWPMMPNKAMPNMWGGEESKVTLFKVPSTRSLLSSTCCPPIFRAVKVLFTLGKLIVITKLSSSLSNTY